MNKIDQLNKDITSLEQQAGLVDQSDFKALYSLLVQAYFKAKDLAVIAQEQIPEPIKVEDTDQINSLNYVIQQQKLEIAGLNKKVDAVISIVTPGLH